MIIESPSSTALLGNNGSGKSTLLQIIAGYIRPTKGELVYINNGNKIDPELMFQSIAFCAPYLELIEEMTLIEFFNYHFSFKKPLLSIHEMIGYVGLENASDKLIEKFSSGMKQRVKLAQAIFADTPIVLLDEPCTNLDEDGIKLYKKLIDEYCRTRILLVASNDIKEYDICHTKYLVNGSEFETK